MMTRGNYLSCVSRVNIEEKKKKKNLLERLLAVIQDNKKYARSQVAQELGRYCKTRIIIGILNVLEARAGDSIISYYLSLREDASFNESELRTGNAFTDDTLLAYHGGGSIIISVDLH